MARTINNYSDLWYYLRKKQRFGAGRAVLGLQGAEMVRQTPTQLKTPPKTATVQQTQKAKADAKKETAKTVHSGAPT